MPEEQRGPDGPGTENANQQLENKKLLLENKKLKRQLANLETTIERTRYVVMAKEGLSASITAEKSRQEKYLSLLLENAPDIILILDVSARFAYCTDAFLHRAGISNFGLINGRTFREVFAPIAPAPFVDRMDMVLRQVMRDGQSVALNETVDFGDAEDVRSYTIQITPMLGEGGATEGALALFHDLTDLLRAKNQAEAASRAKSDFLATVSHEIRTPMNAIIGISEMLAGTELSEKQREYLGTIQNSSKTLLALINDLLDFSRIEAGRLELVNAPFDLPALLFRTRSLFDVMFRQKSLLFTCTFEDNLPKTLLGDERRVGQILTNLLTNALKYTDEGSVALVARGGERPGQVHFDVVDTGIGIREGDMDRLFSAFEQLDRVKNKNVAGAGLGLAITARLCQLMNGDITVESVYGEGSRFSVNITLPLAKESDFVIEAEEAPIFIAPGAKVLLVDDIEINLVVTTYLLEEYGIDPDTALSGAEALEKVQATNYDLIFMDHMMPEMDGIEATQAIRKLGGHNAAVPVVALTANAVQGMMDLFLSSGFDDFLAKPVDRRQLALCLLRWLPKNIIEEEPGGDAK